MNGVYCCQLSWRLVPDGTATGAHQHSVSAVLQGNQGQRSNISRPHGLPPLLRFLVATLREDGMMNNCIHLSI